MTTPSSLTPLFAVDFQTKPPVFIDSPVVGSRMFVEVVGGVFKGPELRGTVLSGADWAVRQRTGHVAVDARLHLRTDEGTDVLMTYDGIATPDDGTVRIVVTPHFETNAEGPLGWLSTAATVA